MDDYIDSPMDSDDVFPCKGCGEVSSCGSCRINQRRGGGDDADYTATNIASL